MFGDSDEAKQALADLNDIVHPAMQDEIERQIAAQAETDRVVVLDFPLLGENPRDDIAATVVVDVPARGRDPPSRRVSAGWTKRMLASGSSARSIVTNVSHGATHVVDNSGDLEQLRHQVEALWQELDALRTAGA